MEKVDLDNINKATFCIPYYPPIGNDGREQESRRHCFPSSPFPDRDLKEGGELRFTAYRAAWKKCLDKMQDIIHSLQRSTIDSVVKEVKGAYTTILPGLPYSEIPVVSVINLAFGSSFMDRITDSLEATEDDDSMDNSSQKSCLVIHLHPEDFSSVSSGMKAIVSRFIDKDDTPERVKRKATSSLAEYDIRYLDAWYRSWMASKDFESPSNLVVLVHDFEQCDPFVMQDIFYVCSRACPQIPLIFLLSIISPMPSYLNLIYRPSTLSLLRVRTVVSPSGIHVLQEIWLKTFFDVDFDPDIVVGPKVLGFLRDYFMRHNSSIDVILTVLQIAHLKHFASDPITLFVHDTPSTLLGRPESAALLRSLGARIVAAAAARQEELEMDLSGPRLSTGIATVVDKARGQFQEKAKDMRLGFGIMKCVQTELRKHGHTGLEWSPDVDKDGGLCDAMIDLLRGCLVRDVKLLKTLAKKLKVSELRSILDSLLYYFYNMPSQVRTREQEARSHLILLGSQLPKSDDDSETSKTSEIALTFSDWIKDYLCEKLGLLEEVDLWDIWYTGLSPPATELLNPSIRASVVAGLLRPHEYVNDPNKKVSSVSPETALWELPDTNILFKRYLDSGKMINIYDWFESFKSVLETQRARLVETAATAADSSSSPRKRGRSKSAKAKQKGKATMTEEEEEKWKVEIQARFIRALHELDSLGFIKHTGRKADHIVRTVFEVDDDDDPD